MTRAYIRLDPAFDERKESYPDGPFAALVSTFCLAEHQPERGRFRSFDYLTRLLGRRGRHARYLLDHGDIVTLDDGRVYVDGWDEWQEGDWKVSERVGRIRSRQRRTVPVTPPVTVGVTVDVTPDRQAEAVAKRSGSEAQTSGADRRADLDAFELIKHRAPSLRQRQLLDAILDRHDLTGPAWAADVMLKHPDDPIGAVLEADREWRQARIAEAKSAERPKPTPRRPRGLPESTKEILAHWAATAKSDEGGEAA